MISDNSVFRISLLLNIIFDKNVMDVLLLLVCKGH